METPALANDKYRATLRSTFVDGVDTTLNVTAIPTNLPTIVTVGWNTQYETVFRITGTSGTNSSNYALTGITKIKGYSGNLPENLAVNCLNHEEFFNQWGEQIAAVQAIAEGAEAIADVVNSTWIDLVDGATITLNLASGDNRKFRVTLGGNRTFAISNPLLGQVFMLRITNDGTPRVPVWFSGITWMGIENNPDMSDYVAANKTGVFVFVCTDATGGSENYDGYFLGAEE